ncbi:uncharacterized protein J7T54_007781 [Emericellopsis cladophorae]|uniref:Uncharacterized protein n=1 Tax=Emericellopsis cladophorae TaxID=2686198 RepID=A0A9P9Y7U1_9HYPO|nr:uncharacterized protein J7T54_007781 [Emericellopsis cladophorae]KAI6784688.1 hypothetical protein J7T54_007781 [Emericellopsis cladophorae]
MPQQTSADSPDRMPTAVHDHADQDHVDHVHVDSSNNLSMFDGVHDFLLDAAAIDNDQSNEFGTPRVPDGYTTTTANLPGSIFIGPSVTTGSSLSWRSMTATPSLSQILPPSESRPSSSSSSSLPGLQLSEFQQNLTSHLAQLRSTPWDILSTLRLESTPCLTCHRPAIDPLLGAAFDPLTSTFRHMAEFERIISHFRTRGMNLHITSGAAAAAADDHGPPMELSYVLTAVSCYIQLVLIYDCILSHLAEQCANNRIVRDFILLSAPSLSLGGQALPPSRNLLGKSLVRLLESRIGTIEALLGLPDEVRVSRGGRRRRKGRGRNAEGAEDECGASVSDRSEGPGLVGKSLLGVLHASLMTRESDNGRPAILESLRARMVYLEQLA